MKIFCSGQAYLFYLKSFSVQYTYCHFHLQIKKVLMDRNSFETEVLKSGRLYIQPSGKVSLWRKVPVVSRNNAFDEVCVTSCRNFSHAL